jgi:hypothetical protein
MVSSMVARSAIWLLCVASAVAQGLSVELTVADGLMNGTTIGRAMVMIAPAGTDPLDDTDVVTSPNYFYARNMYDYTVADTMIIEGGSGDQPRTSTWGFPNITMDEVEEGDYTIQAFFNIYETVTRSDGSVVSVRFPCGDGAEPVAGPGSLLTEAVNVTLDGDAQVVKLTFTNVTEVEEFMGEEIGGCSQGNYEDTDFLKYIKIRSDVLSEFWNRDMYVGANVLLPAGYDENDTETRYPVIYHQGHWPADVVGYGYPNDEEFVAAWNNGTVTNTTNPAPKLIIVSFRHETAFYDDSYAVNTANIGPYGDAINDELIPYIESKFNTIAAPYGRVQDGGSTGGWESAANLIFRPDLFGVCFSSYPDSLSFYKHQDIDLYNSTSAYTRPDGSKVYSIRENINDTLTDVTTVEQENHWELTFGTNSRSALQWDVWNAVFGAQGYNGYPLEPWDKVTGEIYPDAVEYWQTMDLANHIVTHWDDELALGERLKDRIFVYVGSWDNYFLNEGVEQFQRLVDAKGGEGWANITILEGQPHGGNYQRRPTWDYLQFVADWVAAHAPDGPSPLPEDATSPAARGNKWEDVLAHGGRDAAVARQEDPTVSVSSDGSVQGSAGRWDPGVVLTAQWLLNGQPSGETIEVSGEPVPFSQWAARGASVQLQVTGRKRGYVDETRTSESVQL